MDRDSTNTDATKDSGKMPPPFWFWVVTVGVYVWFLMDVAAFVLRVLMTDDVMQALPEAQQHVYRNMPSWVNAVFAAEVFGGSFGCVGLLLRRKWALPFFVISMAGVLSQTFYIYFLSDAISIMGASAVVMPLVAILIGTGMIGLSRLGISRRWIR